MAETGAAVSLETPAITLDLNGDAPPTLRVLELPGFDSPILRTSVDNNPQGEGGIGHNAPWGSRYFDLVALMDVSSAEDRADLDDDVKAAVESIRYADGRYNFTPSGKDPRFVTVRLDGQISEESIGTDDFGGAAGVRKKLTIPLRADNPYAYTAEQVTTDIAAGGSAVIANAGTAISFPVLQAFGPFTALTLGNSTLRMWFAFGDDTAMAITAGHYVEIILGPVVNSAYLDGNSANELGFEDDASSDWWWLARGNNTITAAFTGAGVGTKLRVLSNDAWL